MNPDTRETVALDTGEMAALAGSVPGLAGGATRPSTWLAGLRADPARMAAVRDSWRALWSSRVFVWAVGLSAVFALGLGSPRHAFSPPGTTGGWGWLADRLAAPAARWDAAWYMVIAHHGYRPGLVSGASRAAFFPLYPLTMSAIGQLGVPLVLAGIGVSMGALALALYGLHRLTTLELGGSRSGVDRSEVGRLAVLCCALFPMAFFFSAVYSESLYLALSIGVFWCARRGRWGTACGLAALAAATRSAGIALALPIAMLYLYGPRQDRPPDRPAARWLQPRYRVRADMLWVALVPAGLAAYMGYLSLSGGHALMPFHAQAVWHRTFAGPFAAVWQGAVAAWDGLLQLASGQRHHVYFSAARGSPFIAAQHNLTLFAFLVAALPATIGVLRRLPVAYGAYMLAALAMPLSYPVPGQPLMSLPRFLAVLFPVYMCAGARLVERSRLRAPALVASGLLMCIFVSQFATWHWVA